MKQTYTEDEFKTLLKNLFAEKNRSLELQKQLENEASITIENDETVELRERFEKIKPALQQLMAELKGSKEKIESLEEEKLNFLKTQEKLSEEKKKLEKLLIISEEEKKQSLYLKENGDSEEKKNFEEERQKLIERLADTLTQMQKMGDNNKDLREELVTLHRELKLTQQEKKRLEETMIDVKFPQEELQKKIDEIEKNKEDVLSRSYQELKNLSQKNASLEEERSEYEREIKKAHHHLAKKIKENTLLRDAYDKQKIKLVEFQNILANRKMELENLQQNLSYQRSQEEKYELLTKEKIETLETSSKEWMEKYLELQKEWQKQKEELIVFENLKKSYEKLFSTFSHVKDSINKFSLDG